MSLSFPFYDDDVNGNETDDITKGQKITLLIISYSITLLSLTAGISILTLFIRTWHTCTQIGKMGFCLTLANLIYSVTNLLPLVLDSSSEDNSFCLFDGPLRMFSTLSCIVWATKIAITAFRALVTEEYHSSHPLGITWGFIIPALVALIPLIPNPHEGEFRYYIYYDTLGFNCNVYSHVKILRRIWPIIFNIIPMMISMVLTIYANIKIIKHIRTLNVPFKVPTRRFLAYPLSLIIAWGPLNFFRFMYFVTDYSFALDLIEIVFSRSSGMINAVIYGWERLRAANDVKNAEILREMCARNAEEDGINATHDDSYSDLSICMDEDYQKAMSFDPVRRSSVHKL